MTDTDRLAAVLRTQLHDAIRGWFGCEHKGPQGEWPCEDFYARLMGSPTLNAVVCPDPADHKLAEAVARLAETGKVEPNLYFRQRRVSRAGLPHPSRPPCR